MQIAMIELRVSLHVCRCRCFNKPVRAVCAICDDERDVANGIPVELRSRACLQAYEDKAHGFLSCTVSADPHAADLLSWAIDEARWLAARKIAASCKRASGGAAWLMARD